MRGRNKKYDEHLITERVVVVERGIVIIRYSKQRRIINYYIFKYSYKRVHLPINLSNPILYMY